MSHYIKINTSALRNDSRKIEDMAQNAEKELNEVYSLMEILDSKWDGPANEAFRQQFQGDYESFKAACSYVKSFANQLENAAKEYESCEDAINSAVKAIRV